MSKNYTRTQCFQAVEIFDKFCAAQDLKQILHFYSKLCATAQIHADVFSKFFPYLKELLISAEGKELLSNLEKRSTKKYYENGKACKGIRVLIIGAGPVGLRLAIEAQLMGCKVTILEKREDFSRKNVLHLWPYVITDLKNLGLKRLCPKFCAGAIDHVSICALQKALLKLALLLGTQIYMATEYLELSEPNPEISQGWTAQVRTKNSKLQENLQKSPFDVIVGADGRRNCLPGFRRKVLRAKLAIAITANFVNHRTENEARVEEISGVSFIFKQHFFSQLCEEQGIELENIVYYKDDTHYFVMTAKKRSLLYRGVLLEDFADSKDLLSPENVDRTALEEYVKDAVEFATEGQLTDLEFSINSRGESDVAIIDFTNMYAAENSCRAISRHGYSLLIALAGDSLLEPFWPTGSGCARGFLSALDTCWMIRQWSQGRNSVLEVLAERESIYRLLGQATHDNLNKDHANYSVDPWSRYLNLNTQFVTPSNVRHLYDSDENDDLMIFPVAKETNSEDRKETGEFWHQTDVDVGNLFTWTQEHVEQMGLELTNLIDIFVEGNALCILIHRFRPDLIPEFPLPPEVEDKNLSDSEAAVFRNQLAFDIMHNEYQFPNEINGHDSVYNVDHVLDQLVIYLNQMKIIFDPQNSSLQEFSEPVTTYNAVCELEDAKTFFHKANEIQKFKTCDIKPVQKSSVLSFAEKMDAQVKKNGKREFENISQGNCPSFAEKRKKGSEEAKHHRRLKMMALLHKRKSFDDEGKKLNAEQRAEALRAVRSLNCAPVVVKDEFRTIKNDEFFDEYNLRLHSKKMSLGKIGEKIDSAIFRPFKVTLPSSSDKSSIKSSQATKFDDKKIAQHEHMSGDQSVNSVNPVSSWQFKNKKTELENKLSNPQIVVPGNEDIEPVCISRSIKDVIKRVDDKQRISVLNAQYYPGATKVKSLEKSKSVSPLPQKNVGLRQCVSFSQLPLEKNVPSWGDKVKKSGFDKKSLQVPAANSRSKSPDIDEQLESVQLDDQELNHLIKWTERNFNCYL